MDPNLLNDSQRSESKHLKLDQLGAAGAYLLLKDAFPEWTTLNALWGIHAALMEIDWKDLPVEIKDQLLTEVAEQAS